MLIAQWSNCKESSEITNSCYQNEKTKKNKKQTKKKPKKNQKQTKKKP